MLLGVTAAAAIAIIVILSFYVSRPQETGSVTNLVAIKVGYVPVISSLPTFVALSNGYFKNAGFDVSATSYQDSNQLAEAVADGSTDVAGYVSTDPILGLSQKDPNLFEILGIGTLDKSSPFTALLVSNDSSLTVNDLPGKKVAVFPGSTAKILLSIATSNMFGHEVDYQAIPMPPTLWLSSLSSNQVQYVLSYEPFATLGVETGTSKIISSGVFENYVMNDMPSSVVAVTSKFAEDNPQEAQKLEGVYKKSIDFINSNPSAAREIATKYMPIDSQIAMKVNLNSWYMAGDINATALQEYDNILVKHDEFQTSVDVSKMILS